MDCDSPSKMNNLAKQIFPSLFRKYKKIPEETITKCLVDSKFDERIATNTLDRMVTLFAYS